MKFSLFLAAAAAAATSAANAADAPTRFNELVVMDGHTKKSHVVSPLPHTYITEAKLPAEWDWNDQEGGSCLTHMLNQHIPQYCGSCWAFASLSALADRIKIARGCKGDDINLSPQFVLNCGAHVAGSCHGGSHTGAYQFIKDHGSIPFDTCAPYVACSDDSSEGFCPHVDTTCTALNTCRTCSTFSANGGDCVALDYYPNATVAEYGTVDFDASDDALNVRRIKSEIKLRGPVAASVNADPLVDFMGGEVFDNDAFIGGGSNHVVSITGWGVDDDGTEFWHVRNSWGQYWGEEGFFRVATGKNMLNLEADVGWATPGQYTVHNVPCDEDGATCGGVANSGKTMAFQGEVYVDPSTYLSAKQ